MDAINAAKTDSTVFAHEWASTMVHAWDRQGSPPTGRA
jgi:hypothetical protein